MRNFITILLLLPLVSGCASTVGAFYNRPVVEDDVGGTLRTVSLSADRRTVLVVNPSVETPKFCAEPPPDTATGLKTDLDASAEHKNVTLALKDKFETSVTVLSARNAPLDAFRTGTFTLCQFYLNGAIDKKDMRELFVSLIDMFKETQNLVNEVSSTSAAKENVPNKEGAAAPATLSDVKPKAATALETKVAKK